MCYSARRWLSSAQSLQKLFQRKNAFAQPESPAAQGLRVRLLASLTLFLFFTVFILPCLYFCVFSVSFVSPESTAGQQFARMLWWPLCLSQLSLGSSIFEVLCLKYKGPRASAIQPGRPGSILWHHGANRCLRAGCRRRRPPGSCTPRRHHPPPNVPPWLCYSQLNYSIMTSLLSPNSPNYSLEIYYLIW